ncbi:hypothetical protein J2Z69_001881 [Paenibacillus shirakamiensis]|uniref:Uncharacterized protein n=1 Tax=Paenibacillus shirakamiensis TaxID=1265935 RepID=A0ABS4JGJ1_9BACL|nr:hypothetical protein [Paenibacillus shirakamiensis]
MEWACSSCRRPNLTYSALTRSCIISFFLVKKLNILREIVKLFLYVYTIEELTLLKEGSYEY